MTSWTQFKRASEIAMEKCSGSLKYLNKEVLVALSNKH